MTSHDVRDMLDLPGDIPRPAKKQKLAAARPVLKGLAREVQNLSGDNPIAIVPEVTVFKKRRLGVRKPAAKWELKPFKNSARNDDSLVLRHWRRKAEVPPASADHEHGEPSMPERMPKAEDSTFAKFNVRVQIPKYDDEQYNTRLRNDDWSRDETDYLLDLVQQYDLRWPVIWDRYEYEPPEPQGVGAGAMVIIPKTRSMEDLKARYYFIAAAMLKVNKPPELMNAAEFNLLELMQQFNPAQEAMRKRFAETTFYRTKDEAKEEESLLLELKRILARSERLNEERKELYARLDAPQSQHGAMGIYSSSQGLHSLLQQLMAADKSKKRRSTIMGSDGVSPAGPSGLHQQGSFDRRDSTNRESMSGPGGSNNKKGPSQGISERRQLTAEEEKMYGVKHIDRITSSGPAFRHEKISKPITSKSSIQQQKIANVLTELRISSRLRMPTEEVGKQFEILLQNINILLDQRKLADKLTGEINIAKAVKAEREKKERLERGEPEPSDEDGGAEAGDGRREKSAAPSARAGSVHKRSASVMSGVSDKSTKRQKK